MKDRGQIKNESPTGEKENNMKNLLVTLATALILGNFLGLAQKPAPVVADEVTTADGTKAAVFWRPSTRATWYTLLLQFVESINEDNPQLNRTLVVRGEFEYRLKNEIKKYLGIKDSTPFALVLNDFARVFEAKIKNRKKFIADIKVRIKRSLLLASNSFFLQNKDIKEAKDIRDQHQSTAFFDSLEFDLYRSFTL